MGGIVVRREGDVTFHIGGGSASAVLLRLLSIARQTSSLPVDGVETMTAEPAPPGKSTEEIPKQIAPSPAIGTTYDSGTPWTAERGGNGHVVGHVDGHRGNTVCHE